ncbi:MAG: efflux transporter outer membrane subunit [Deltaproteobacteria bacterium]|nr:efflux transporter outer membrane subunit [Deltaproteobacteria bacterium]
MRRSKALVTGVLGGLLVATSGCLSTSRGISELEVEIPDRWSSQEGGQEAAPDEHPWWESFGDARLSDLIEEALEHNQDLVAAEARLRQAEQRARIAGADLKPQLSAGLNGSRSRRNFIGFPFPGGEEQVSSSTTTNFGVSLDISWEVDLWGRLRAGHVASRADFRAASWDLEGARLSLAGQTAKAWFALTEAQHQVMLAQQTRASRQDTAAMIRRRYEQGLRSSVDLRLASAGDATALAAVAARERQLDGARRQLEVLLGRYPSGEVAPAEDWTEALEPVEPGLPAQLLARRPDLRAAQQRMVARDAQVSQAKGALLPTLRLTGGAGQSGEELADLLDGDFSVWSLAAGLLQPLFQGGRLRAGVSLAEASRDEVLASYFQAALRAFGEVEMALVSGEFLARQEEALAEAAKQAQGAEEVSQQRYVAGLADYLEVLESQRQAVDFQSRYLDLRRQRLASRVDLYLALGGGFSSAREGLEQPMGATDASPGTAGAGAGLSAESVSTENGSIGTTSR